MMIVVNKHSVCILVKDRRGVQSCDAAMLKSGWEVHMLAAELDRRERAARSASLDIPCSSDHSTNLTKRRRQSSMPRPGSRRSRDLRSLSTSAIGYRLPRHSSSSSQIKKPASFTGGFS